jgi:hypothetical protein
MSGIRTSSTARAAGICLSLSLFLAGCRGASFVEGGPEIRYLKSTPPAVKAAKTKDNSLLPLTVGTRWEMRQIGVPPKRAARIDMRIVGRDDSGSLMEVRKDGQLWRREVYLDTPSGLFLTGMGEDNKPMMRLSPPVPVVLHPAAEGSEKAWNGTFKYENLSYAANGYSRVSALETIAGTKGKKSLAYRTDTIVSVNQDGNIVRFPTLRWLVPGVGFVRRSFVDQGRPVYAQLQKFTPG